MAAARLEMFMAGSVLGKLFGAANGRFRDTIRGHALRITPTMLDDLEADLTIRDSLTTTTRRPARITAERDERGVVLGEPGRGPEDHAQFAAQRRPKDSNRSSSGSRTPPSATSSPVTRTTTTSWPRSTSSCSSWLRAWRRSNCSRCSAVRTTIATASSPSSPATAAPKPMTGRPYSTACTGPTGIGPSGSTTRSVSCTAPRSASARDLPPQGAHGVRQRTANGHAPAGAGRRLTRRASSRPLRHRGRHSRIRGLQPGDRRERTRADSVRTVVRPRRPERQQGRIGVDRAQAHRHHGGLVHLPRPLQNSSRP